MAASPQAILLDIEGTTSSISFVHDVLFPYALDRVDQFLAQHGTEPTVHQACQQIAADAGCPSLDALQRKHDAPNPLAAVAEEVRQQTAADLKATGLKALQGLIWQGGFVQGELQAHVYPDVIPAIRRWRSAGIDVRIYSSGSVAAQKMFFGHLAGQGDCLDLFSGHYDTHIGSKKDPDSYRRIAQDWGVAPQDILFLSDIPAELNAAEQAGLQVLASVRPGNAPLPEEFAIRTIRSFEDVSL